MRFSSVQNCRFENITNGDTGSSINNVDTDGLKISGGHTGGSDYIFSSAIISNNVFINCKGRSIKLKVDEVVVKGNSFSLNILPILAGGFEVDVQTSSGIVTANVFHYDEATGGLSPFDEDGGTTPQRGVVSFYNNEADLRTRMASVTDNIVYSNVGALVGNPSSFLSCGGQEATPSSRINVSGNIVSKVVKQFIDMTPIFSSGNKIYLNASNNYVDGLTTAFIYGNNSGSSNNIIKGSGNINNGAEVPFGWYLTTPFNANYSVIDSVGMTPDAYLERANSLSFPSKINHLAPDGGGGLLSVQAVTIADDATYVFPISGWFSGNTFRILSVGANETFTGIFVDGSNAVTDYGGGLSTGLEFAGATPTVNPDVDTKVNIFRSGSSIAIKNRIGSSRLFTLVTIG
jgi:hypothetical protein